MALLTISNPGNSSAMPFNAQALVGTGGALTNLGGDTQLEVFLDSSKISVFTHVDTSEVIGLAIDEDIPGVYRHPTTGTDVSFLLVNDNTVSNGLTVRYQNSFIDVTFT